MDDDSRALDKGWDALPQYEGGAGDAEEAVTVSISTAPGEWLVNTTDSVVVPMSMAEVVEALRAGRLTDRSLVWRNGMQEWLQVERVPQLKLAARLSAAPSRPAPRLTPPPKPAKSLRSSTAPQGTPRALVTAEAPSNPRASITAEAPSNPRASITTEAPSNPRASITTEAPSNPRASRPSSLSTLPPRSRPTLPPRQSAPRAALPPPPGNGEHVLAVYERPAATISFDLEPEAPPASHPPSASVTPQTLAPITTDSAPSRPAQPHRADLSVVAASHFRAQQRSSQRLVLISSVASAAAASLLTLWLSSGSPRPSAAAAPVASELPSPRPSPVTAPAVAPLPAPEAAAEPAPPAPVESASPKAKPKRKARAWHPPRVPAVAASAASDPNSEPNPYEIKLAEDPPAVPKAPADSASSDGASRAVEGSTATGSDSPGL